MANRRLPEKFPDTGINELNGFGPSEWPSAVGFVDGAIRANREQALGNIASIPLSERQLTAISTLALPAINETLTEILGREAAQGLISNTFVSYFSEHNFDTYYHGSIRAAGVYYPDKNHAAIRESRYESDSPEGLAYFIEVFIHEYFHFLSHQSAGHQDGRLFIKRMGVDTIANDIREANKGNPTWDYFLSYNEAITEMLTIETVWRISRDIMFKNQSGLAVNFYETYDEYRDLIHHVMDDAIRYQATGMTKPNLWRRVCRGYLTGQVRPLLDLARMTYPGIRAKEFGLMTHVDDLPRDVDFVFVPPDERPSSGRAYRVSNEYLQRLRNRLNGKTSRDYTHDLGFPPPPPPSPAKVHQRVISEHQAEKMRYLQIYRRADAKLVDAGNGIVEYDENGNFVHYDESWLLDLLPVLADVSTRFKQGEINDQQAGVLIDELLFDQRRISELSNGFGDFYVIKHVLLDPNTSDGEFNTYHRKIQAKLKELRGHSY